MSSSWWDRLFGTYRAQPRAGHLGMNIGIDRFRTPEHLRLDRMLIQPFVDTAPDAAGTDAAGTDAAGHAA